MWQKGDSDGRKRDEMEGERTLDRERERERESRRRIAGRSTMEWNGHSPSKPPNASHSHFSDRMCTPSREYGLTAPQRNREVR